MPEGPVTVYIVDDDESVRKALERLLRSAGYRALTFQSAEDFLEATSGGGKGCLVLDIRLPGITGLDLQEKLASLGAKYSIIFMTAHDNPQWQERAMKRGSRCLLEETFSRTLAARSDRARLRQGRNTLPEHRGRRRSNMSDKAQEVNRVYPVSRALILKNKRYYRSGNAQETEGERWLWQESKQSGDGRHVRPGTSQRRDWGRFQKRNQARYR